MYKKNLLNICFILILSIVTISCGSPSVSLENANKTTLTNSDVDLRFKASITKLLEKYYRLSTAVQNENKEEINTITNAFIKKLKAIDILILTDQQQLDWNVKSENILFSLEQIKNTKEMEEIRLNFWDLSEFTLDAIEKFGVEQTVVYVFKCTDDKDKSEYTWLSKVTNLNNPYGKALANCGSITDQITFE
jgi:hypothetical protein